MNNYTAGSIVRSTGVFVPESGNTTLGNITARATSAEGIVTSLAVSQDSTDHYHADVTVPDNSITGPWVVRWESSTPVISFEDHFLVTASAMPNP